MGLPASKTRMTVEEYFQMEETSEVKHEFDEGEVLAMSGGTPPHSAIATNFLGSIWMRLRGNPCRPYDSNLRIRAGKSTRYVYPDALVICGPLEFDPLDPNGTTVLNPTMLAEVLSKSTERYDRGTKFDRYREIESLQEYVLIDQNEPRVDVFLRRESNWTLMPVRGIEGIVRLESLSIELPMAEIYEGVVFPAREDNAA